jgi:hypothetical protein
MFLEFTLVESSCQSNFVTCFAYLIIKENPLVSPLAGETKRGIMKNPINRKLKKTQQNFLSQNRIKIKTPLLASPQKGRN